MSATGKGMTQVEVNETLIELMQQGRVVAVRINGEYRFTLAQQRHKMVDYLVPVEEAIDYLKRCNEAEPRNGIRRNDEQHGLDDLDRQQR